MSLQDKQSYLRGHISVSAAITRRGLAYALRHLIVPLLVGVFASIYAAHYYALHQARVDAERASTATIAVLVPNGDPQGSQFSTGVGRAMRRLDQLSTGDIGSRVVKLRYFNESVATDQAGAARIADEVARARSPLVIGPMTSGAARWLVPEFVRRGVPMILGIPTNTALTRGVHGYVWRLSPTDADQARAVGGLAARVSPSAQAHVYWDLSENATYSEPLGKSIGEGITKLHDPAPICGPVTMITAGSAAKEIAAAPRATVVYAGMPRLAGSLIGTALEDGATATWILTDGCVDRTLMRKIGSLQQAGRAGGNRFFVTFQAPPASASDGIKAYLETARINGEEIAGAVDMDDCDPESRAVSYEVYGYDAYVAAVDVLRRARSLSSKDVLAVMRENEEGSPLLLMGPYEFRDGDAVGRSFHVYQIADGCLVHCDSLCTADMGR